MLTRIQHNAANNCGLSAGQVVLVGVSGGPDSLCLLDVLSRLGYCTIAAYFNHQLRPEAQEEQDQVEQFAARLQVPFVSGSGDVAGLAREAGKSTEETAREMRYAFLFECARAHRADAVAVGHNADDQVETVLMHLLRGSGLTGLRGMGYRSITQWDDGIPLIRPLLGVWRDEILGYCANAGLHPLLDSSNLERTYLRNRVRLDLIPVLEGLADGARQRILNFSHLAADDLQLMDAVEDAAWQRCVVEHTPGSIRFNLAALRDQPEALQRRLLRRGAVKLRPLGGGLSLKHTLRAVEHLQSGAPGQKIELGDQLLLRKTADILLMEDQGMPRDTGRFPSMLAADLLPVALNEPIALGEGWFLLAEDCDPPTQGEWFLAHDGLQLDVWVDAGVLTGPLHLRHARSGDRVQPLGMPQGSQKLSDFWINHKIPVDARKHWPLVVCGDEIVWVPGFAPEHRVRIQPTTRRSIHLVLRREK